MSDEELLEWYKNNSVKPADMSQQDYELNINKALKLKQDNALKQNLQNQQDTINKSKSSALQSASISNEKLMKYLEQTQLASGIAKGQRGSDYINANNNYLSARANIENNAIAKHQELLNNYTADKLANEQSAHNNEINILDKYRNQALEDEDRKMRNDQWQLEMDAYKQEMEDKVEDRKIAKDEKLKIEQENSDLIWLEAANERINKMYSELINEDGTMSQAAKQRIESEIESYKDKFNSDSYYERLLDLYKTMIYNGN